MLPIHLGCVLFAPNIYLSAFWPVARGAHFQHKEQIRKGDLLDVDPAEEETLLLVDI